jgi:hypothetical protein
MASMREQGFRLCLRGADLAFMQLHAATLLPLATHIELPHGHPDFAAIVTQAKHAEPPPQVVVKNFPGWREFDACGPLGAAGFFPDAVLHPAPRRTPARR